MSQASPLRTLDATKPTIFLSSTFTQHLLGERVIAPRDLRRNLADATPEVNVWAYEQLYERDRTVPGPQILDRCADGIEASDLFVFLLTGRHGSGMGLGSERAAVVSYLEAELFTAAAARKPVAVLMLRDAEPDPELAEVLHILRSAYRAHAFLIGDEKELVAHWRMLAQKLRCRKIPLFARLTRLVDALSFARARGTWRQDLGHLPRLCKRGRSRWPYRHQWRDRTPAPGALR